MSLQPSAKFRGKHPKHCDRTGNLFATPSQRSPPPNRKNVVVNASFNHPRSPRLVEATGFEPMLFGWALSEELVQWFRHPDFDAVRADVVRAAAAHCHRVWRYEIRHPDPETTLPGQWSRGWLQSFFRHWMSAALARRAPRLAAMLPPGYNVGHPPSLARPADQRAGL